MARKLPIEAYEHYVLLGTDRSYRAVAQRFGVSKKTVVERAKREDWQGRLERIESEVWKRMERRAVDILVQKYMREIEAPRSDPERCSHG